MSLSALHKCRLCLRLGRFFSIFEEDDSVKLSDMTMSVANIEVMEGDGLPAHVCSTCIENLSAAYVFKAQCQRADLRLRDQAEYKFSGLLNQDLHVHSLLDCSNNGGEYDRAHMDNNINKDISDTAPAALHTAEQTSESEFDGNSTKCSHCQEQLCNAESTHYCDATATFHQNDNQASDSDETVIACNAPSAVPDAGKSEGGAVNCLLCDERHVSYDDYVSHLVECTANVKLHYYVCSACHEVNTEMKSYLQHVKKHFYKEVEVLSIDCVDSPKRVAYNFLEREKEQREREQMRKSHTIPMRKDIDYIGSTKREAFTFLDREKVQEQLRKSHSIPMRRDIGWSFDRLDSCGTKPMNNKETRIPRMVKTFLGLQGTENLQKHSSPAKESILKLIQAGREKTANYHCFGRSSKKLKKKAPKHRSVYARKTIERKLFTRLDDDQKILEKDSLSESFSTISETSLEFLSAEPIYAVIEKKKVFMLSDFLKDREATGRMLRELGAEVAASTASEMRATHFVSALARDTCSGMMVCALATGKWLLHEGYVADSYASGRLLEEEAYLWVNNPKLSRLGSTSVEAARASEYWRQQLQGPERRFPYQGERIVLLMERKYSKYYRLVFKTLKAKVLIYDQREPEICTGATQCFVDMKSVQTCDLMFFANHNIPVYPYQYILIYLLKRGSVSDQHKYLLQDYKTLRQTYARRLNKTY